MIWDIIQRINHTTALKVLSTNVKPRLGFHEIICTCYNSVSWNRNGSTSYLVLFFVGFVECSRICHDMSNNEEGYQGPGLLYSAKEFMSPDVLVTIGSCQLEVIHTIDVFVRDVLSKVHENAFVEVVAAWVFYPHPHFRQLNILSHQQDAREGLIYLIRTKFRADKFFAKIGNFRTGSFSRTFRKATRNSVLILLLAKTKFF